MVVITVSLHFPPADEIFSYSRREHSYSKPKMFEFVLSCQQINIIYVVKYINIYMCVSNSFKADMMVNLLTTQPPWGTSDG